MEEFSGEGTHLLSNQFLIAAAFSWLPHSIYAILINDQAGRTRSRRIYAHPLLFPLTLCSEKVMYLWSMFTPTLSATWRRSSSVVHYAAISVYAMEASSPHTHCRSPI